MQTMCRGLTTEKGGLTGFPHLLRSFFASHHPPRSRCQHNDLPGQCDSILAFYYSSLDTAKSLQYVCMQAIKY